MNRWMLLLGFALVACSGDEPEEDDSDLVEESGGSDDDGLSGDPVAGGELFAEQCANCHGADGVAGDAPDLPETARNYTDGELVTLIRYGREYMPSHDFNRTQMDNVIAYVRQTFP